MAEPKIVWNEPGLKHLTQDWSGPTGRFVRDKAVKVTVLGRASAGYDTGDLIGSIDADYGKTLGGELEAKVGANPTGHTRGYAYWHHEGTWPHEIRARAGKVLRFRSGGVIVYAKRVWHPGTRPVKYLSRWLRDVL